MTSPERDPAVRLRAEVAAYVAGMSEARKATSSMAAQVSKDLGRVEAAYANAERAAVSFAAATARAASAARSAAAIPPPPAARVGGAPLAGGALANERALQAIARAQANMEKSAASAVRGNAALTASNDRAAAAAGAVERAYTAQVAAEIRLAEAATAVATGATTQTVAEERLAAAAVRTAVAQTQAALAAERRVGAETAATAAVERSATADATAAHARGTRAAASAYGPVLGPQTGAQAFAAEQAAIATAARQSAAAEASAAAQSRAVASRRITAYNDVARVSRTSSLVVIAAFGATAAAAIRWEDDYTKVARTLGVTGDASAKLEGQLRTLARTSPSSHKEIAAIALEAAQLGIGAEQVGKFTQTIVQLGTVTDISAQQAASSLAKLLNVTGDSKDSIDRIGSSLVALSNAGASTVPEIIKIAQRFAGAAHIVKLTTPEILGISSALASTGLAAEISGSAMQRVFFKMFVAVKRGGDQLAAFGRLTGQTGAEFAKSFGQDPGAQFLAIVTALDQVTASGGNTVAVLNSMGITYSRDVRVMLNLAAAHKELSKDMRLAGEAYTANTALTAAYARQQETTASKLKVARNEIRDAAITIGAVLLPAIAGAAHGMANLVQAFAGLPSWVRNGITAFAAAVAVLVLFGSVVAKVSAGVLALRRAMVLFAGSTAATAAAGAGAAAAAGATATAATAAAAAAGGATAAAEGAAAGAATAAGAAEASAAAAVTAAGAAKAAFTSAAGAGAAGAGAGAVGRAGLIGAASRLGSFAGRGIALPALIVTGGLVGLDKIDEHLVDTKHNVDQTTAALLEFQKTGRLTGDAAQQFGTGFTALDRAFLNTEKHANSAREAIRGFLNKGPGSLGNIVDNVIGGTEAIFTLGQKDGTNRGREAQQMIADTDAALAHLVDTGRSADASLSFAQAVREAKNMGLVVDGDAASMDRFIKMFPKYAAAQTGPQGEAAKTQKATEDATAAVQAYEQSLSDLKSEYFASQDASEKYQLDLLALQGKARGTAVTIDDLRAAVQRTVDDNQAAGTASDAYKASLNELRVALKGAKAEANAPAADLFAGERAANALARGLDDLKATAAGTADEIDKVSSAIGKMLDTAFSGQDAVDAFDSKVAEIKKRIAEAPGQGIAVDLSLVGSTDSARQNRDDVQQLVAREAALIKEDIRVGNDAAESTARRSAELKDQLDVLGYSRDETARYVDALRQVPAALADVGAAGDKASKSLTGSAKAALDNQTRIMDLIEAEKAAIEAEAGPNATAAQTKPIVAAHKAKVRSALIDAGFDPKEIQAYIDKLDLIPAAMDQARTKSAKPRSASLLGDSDDAIANRNAVRQLVGETATKIEQDARFAKSQQGAAAAAKDYRDELTRNLRELGFADRDFAPFLSALDDVQAGYADAKKSVKDFDPTLSASTDLGIRSRQALRDLAKDAADQIIDYGKNGDKTADQIATFSDKIEKAYLRQATALGVPIGKLRDERDYIREIAATVAGASPLDIKVQADVDAATTKLKGIGDQLAALKAEKAKLPIGADTTEIDRQIGLLTRQYNDTKAQIEGAKIRLGADGAGALSEVDKVRTGLLEKLKAGHLWDFTVGANTAPVDTSIDAMRKRINAGGDLHVGVNANTPDLGLWRNDVQKNFDTWPLRLHIVPQVNDPATATGFTIAKPTQAPVGVFKPVKKAAGGWVHGPGGPTDDRVPAWLSNREFVMPADKAARYGRDLEAMRGGRYGAVDTRRGFTAQVPGRSFTDLHRAPATAPRVAPVDYERIITGIAAAIDSRPVQVASTLNLDSKVLARSLGDVANQRTRTR